MSTEKDNKPALFEGKRIRKTLHEGAWWFVIVDVVAALTSSTNPSGYLRDMRRRDPSLAEAFKGGAICPPLALEFATAGGPQKLQCWNTEGIFRLIQSIPSPKAEPFKRWLARVGKEWIDKRLRGIAVRQDLTGEWQDRGAQTALEYAILTNEIMQGAFGLKVDEYKQVKDLERENLRDHMTDIELILTMLAEATTTELHRDRDSQGMKPLKKDARDGGAVAGRAQGH